VSIEPNQFLHSFFLWKALYVCCRSRARHVITITKSPLRRRQPPATPQVVDAPSAIHDNMKRTTCNIIYSALRYRGFLIRHRHHFREAGFSTHAVHTAHPPVLLQQREDGSGKEAFSRLLDANTIANSGPVTQVPEETFFRYTRKRWLCVSLGTTFGRSTY
jgi:hypothetical protein